MAAKQCSWCGSFVTPGNRCHTCEKIMPLDTSKLGPIKHEPDQDAARAKLVRDAIGDIMVESNCIIEWGTIWRNENDAVLAKLGRLLK